MKERYHKENISCNRCIHLIPHHIYEYLGFCEKRSELIITTAKPCSDFREISLEKLKRILQERGWIYCATCKKPIYFIEELEKHSGEKLTYKVYIDEAALEESPCAS